MAGATFQYGLEKLKTAAPDSPPQQTCNRANNQQEKSEILEKTNRVDESTNLERGYFGNRGK
jgi:hypothetical protein